MKIRGKKIQRYMFAKEINPKECWYEDVIDIDPASLLEQLPKVDVSKVKAGDEVWVRTIAKEDRTGMYAIGAKGLANVILHIHTLQEQEKAGQLCECGKKRIYWHCHYCNSEYWLCPHCGLASKALNEPPQEQETTAIETTIRELLEKKGVIAAIVEYRRLVNCDLYTAKKYVDELRQEQVD